MKKSMSTSVSKPLMIIGNNISTSRKPLHKFPQPSSQPLLARITNSKLQPEEFTLRCSTSMIERLPTPVPEVARGSSIVATKTMIKKKSLMDRLGVNTPSAPVVAHRRRNSINSVNHSMLGKSRKKSHLPLSHRISSERRSWSKIIQLTLSMPSGPCSPLDPSHHSQNLSGSTSYRERRSTLTLFSLDFYPPLPMTKLPPPLEILTSPSVVVNCPRSSKPTETGPSHGTPLRQPSSVPSLTEPMSCNSTPNISFSFSEPFPTRTPKSSTLTKPSVATPGKSSTLNSLKSGVSGTSKHDTCRKTVQEIMQVPAKRKISPNQTDGLTKCAASGIMAFVNGKPLSAATATSAPSVAETTQARNV
jgi:hypothetical protein